MMNLDQWIDTVYGEIILEENQPIEHFVSVELSSFASFSGIELSSDIPTRTMAWLHGLWNVEPSVIQQSYLGHPLNKVELYVYYFDEIIELEQDEDDLEENEEESTLKKVAACFITDNPSPQFWIENYELRALQRLIAGQTTAKPSNSYSNQQKHKLAIKEDIHHPRGKAILAITQLMRLIPDLDESTPPNTAHNIIAAKLAELGIENFAVSSRQFCNWLKEVT